jgi:Na+-driven multidrug efflux pump
LYFLALIPIIGFSSVTKTYVSQILAEGDVKKLTKALRRIFLLTLATLVVFVHGNVFYPEALSKLVNGHEYLLHDVTQIQLLIIGSILIHGSAVVLVNIISGCGDTRFSLLIEFLSLTIYLWYSYMIIMVWKKDVVWVWTAEYVYFICMSVFCLIYLRTGRWKKKKV